MDCASRNKSNNHSWMSAFCVLIVASAAIAQDLPTIPLDQGQTADAESVEDALDRAIDDLRMAEQRGDGWQEAFERAKGAIQFALQRDSENLRARYYRARLQIVAGQNRLARSDLETWTESRDGSNDWEGHLILAQQDAAGQFYKLAKPRYRKALDLNPRDARIYTGLAQCSLKLAQRAEAVQWAREAVKLNATSNAYRLLAEALLGNKQLADAERSAQYAVDVDKAAIRENGADVSRLQSLDLSLNALLTIKQALLQANPERTNLYLEVSQLLQSRADVAYRTSANNSLAIAFKGLQLNNPPPTEEHIVHVAKLLIQLNRPAEAVTLLERMLTQIYPNSMEGKMLLERLRATMPATASDPATDN